MFQVTIIIYLSVVGALLLYMLFLLLVDPLIRKHDPYTQPLHNEEDSEVRNNACIGVLMNPAGSHAPLFAGDASAGRQWAEQRKHGAGAGRGSTAALEEAGAGAAKDRFRSTQNAELNRPLEIKSRF